MGTRRRGSDVRFQWDPRSVTPDALDEAQHTWRNSGAPVQTRAKRSKSTPSGARVAHHSREKRHGDWRSTAKVTGDSSPSTLSFWDMLAREIGWGSRFQRRADAAHPSAHVVNFLKAPQQMERFVSFGHLVALDLFLFNLTWLPLRGLSAAVMAVLALAHQLAPQRLWGAVCRTCRRSDAPGAAAATGGRFLVFGAAQQYDLIKCAVVVVSTLVLGTVQLGRLYHYIRGESGLKLYVFFNILSVMDSLASSFGQDVLDALLKTTRDVSGDSFSVDICSKPSREATVGPGTRRRQRRAAFLLAVHTALTVAYVSVHSALIFVQLVCLNVAVNSKGNSLLPLLVSSNFMELKSSVFKRYEAENLFQVSCSDAVERFALSLLLLLVGIQEMPASLDGMYRLASTIAIVWFFELLVDWTKHAFIVKFNRLHSDLYSTFSAIVAHDLLSVRLSMASTLDPTHASARRLGLSALPLTCVALRVAFSHTNVLPSMFFRISIPSGAAVALAFLLVLLATKVLVNLILLVWASRIVRRQKEFLVAAVALQSRAAADMSGLFETDADTEVALSVEDRSEIAVQTSSAPATTALGPVELDLSRAVSVGSSSVQRRTLRGHTSCSTSAAIASQTKWALSVTDGEPQVASRAVSSGSIQSSDPSFSPSRRLPSNCDVTAGGRTAAFPQAVAAFVDTSVAVTVPAAHRGTHTRLPMSPTAVVCAANRLSRSFSFPGQSGSDAQPSDKQLEAHAVAEESAAGGEFCESVVVCGPVVASASASSTSTGSAIVDDRAAQARVRDAVDGMTPGHLDALMRMDALSQIERYSTHGRPVM